MTPFREQLDKLTKKFKKVYVLRQDLNYMLLPVNKLELNEDNVALVNKITTLFHDNDCPHIKRTKSGGISIARSTWNSLCFDVRAFGAGIEITICAGYSFRIQLGKVDIDEKTKNISGRQAFNRFIKELAKDNIDIKRYFTTYGEDANKQIRKPRIKSYCANEDINQAEVITNAHHLDFHKAYMSGLYLSHPELQATIKRLYDLRNTDNQIKSIFTNAIGFMHSSMINWSYAPLARDGINTFNQILDCVANDLAKSGRRILGYNTDGIWYTGDVYHGRFEGDDLGQWSNDYTNCTIRFKSDGAYEFICDNQYYARIRGKTRLDKIEPDRSKWHWGDIFKTEATPLQYSICNGYLIKEN